MLAFSMMVKINHVKDNDNSNNNNNSKGVRKITSELSV